MISPFTPDELELVSRLLRSRYLSDTTVEEIDAEVQLDPADAATASCPGLYWEARGALPGATASDFSDDDYLGPTIT